MTRYSALILSLLFLVACGGDDESGGTPCAAGTTQQCTCMDGVTMGTQTCDASGVIGACLPCTPVGGAGGMGGMTGGMGGMGSGGMTGGMGGMTGGMGGMTGGMGGMTGGMGGMDMDDDGGVDDGGVDAEVDAGSDSGTDAGDIGEEGAQNGSCRTSGDACDDGLGCYEPDQNLASFCTLECTEDDDCDALGGATWTCFVMGGLCRVICDSANGNDDCPAGFECTDVVGAERCIPMD